MSMHEIEDLVEDSARYVLQSSWDHYTGGTTEQNHEANLRQTEGLKKFFKAIFTEER